MSSFISISAARSNLPKLVNKVSEGLESVTITVNGQPKATLINTEELESIMETAEILAIPGAREEIREGMEQIKQGKFVKLEDLDKK